MFRTHHQPFTHTRLPKRDECSPEYYSKLRDSQVARKNGYGYKQTCYYPLPNGKDAYRKAIAECRDVQETIERNDRNARISSVVVTAGVHDRARDRRRDEYDSRMKRLALEQAELDEESDREEAQLQQRLTRFGVSKQRGQTTPVFVPYADASLFPQQDADPEEAPVPLRRRPPPPPADLPSMPREARGLGDRTVQDQAAIQDAIALLQRFNIPVSMPNGGKQIQPQVKCK